MKVCESMKCVKERVCGLFGKTSDETGNRWVSLGLAVVLVVVLNFAAALFYFSVDITADNSYSLSDVSEEVMDDLAGPMQVKVFFSDNLPAPYNSVRRYLNDLLASYDAEGGRKFSFEFVNVESEEGRKIAESFGVYPVEVREMQSNEFKAKSAYMGLVIIYGDLVEKLGDLMDSYGLEYRLTSAMQKMHSKAGALQQLAQPLRLTLYLDSSLLPYNIAGLDKTEAAVREIYAKVNENNFGKIEFAVVDPSVDGKAADIAAKYGLNLLTLKPGVGRTGNVLPGGDAVIGIVLEHGERFESIPLSVTPTIFGTECCGRP
jgi:hypothetical protein